MAERELSLLGVPMAVHPAAAVPGLVVAAITALIINKRSDRITLSMSAGLLWYIGEMLHTLGHIVSARAIQAPMDTIDFALYPKNAYFNNEVSPHQHIGRASGGFIAALSATLICGACARLVRGRAIARFVWLVAIQHALFVVGSVIPLPIFDGGVILVHIRKCRH